MGLANRIEGRGLGRRAVDHQLRQWFRGVEEDEVARRPRTFDVVTGARKLRRESAQVSGRRDDDDGCTKVETGTAVVRNGVGKKRLGLIELNDMVLACRRSRACQQWLQGGVNQAKCD